VLQPLIIKRFKYDRLRGLTATGNALSLETPYMFFSDVYIVHIASFIERPCVSTYTAILNPRLPALSRDPDLPFLFSPRLASPPSPSRRVEVFSCFQIFQFFFLLSFPFFPLLSSRG
jgi:hypothetical protein